MKISIEVINFESEEANYLIKIKSGTIVLQTQVGNNWNQKFVLDNKRNTEIKIEAWQKIKEDHQFIGYAILPKVEQKHRLSIKHNDKELGILNILYKEIKDPVTQSLLNSDSLNISKIEKQTQAFNKINDSLSLQSLQNQDFGSIDEYFQQNFHSQDLNLQAKKTAEELVKQSMENIFKNINISQESFHVDEDDSNIDQNEKINIQKLQKQLIRFDIMKFEKKRRQIHYETVKLDELQSQIRVDQTEQKQQIANLRKELIEKLLYLEDKIEVLKRELKKEKHHVFASNPNLLNSEAEISTIVIQKQFLERWKSDQVLEQQRIKFVEQQMAEWSNLQQQRKLKIEEQQKKIADEEKNIQEKKKQLQETKNEKKKQAIEQYLKQLSEIQVQRRNELLEANKRYEQKKTEKYLAIKYAEQDALQMLQMQERIKQKLQEGKNPDFDKKEIDQFDQKFNQIHKEKQLKRKIKWEEREAQWNKFKAQYFSEYYEKAKQQYKNVGKDEDEFEEKKQNRLQRLEQYIEKVKENFQPSISIEKKTEMESLKRQLKYQSDFKKYQSLSEKVKAKHIFYGVDYQEVIQKTKNIKLVPLKKIPTKISPRDIGNYYLKQNATFNIKNIHPVQNSSQVQNTVQGLQSPNKLSKIKVIDFLKEQRIKKAGKQQVKVSLLDKEDQVMLDGIQKKLKILDNH